MRLTIGHLRLQTMFQPQRAPSTRRLSSYICRDCLRYINQTRSFTRDSVQLETAPETRSTAPDRPLRKQLKEEAKKRKSVQGSSVQRRDKHVDNWELTVGIEIHAELNTRSKLFSAAKTSLASSPNNHVSPFDTAAPGSQPQFQQATLVPALRAALAFGCEIQPSSSWDRKHYFWWDQPNGYQITQYNEPFAKDGKIKLFAHDDIDPVDHPSITVGLKQIQMEQDTAKTILQPPGAYMLDFNRASHPLIEIITLPHIHNPKTAAALVKKVQSILQAVGANTTGMEMGGLRADVNVSVRPRNTEDSTSHTFEYDGVTGLGQRTEIKNLASFKAVEDAIIAERDRQIRILESGGIVEAETRGFTLGNTETRRLRGKEGEVDYRYMPDPDLGAVNIQDALVDHLRSTRPILPDESLMELTENDNFGLTMKDAKTLIALDDGERLEFYQQTLSLVRAELTPNSEEWKKAGKLVSNWVLMDVPSFLAAREASFPYNTPAPSDQADPPQLGAHTLAAILTHLFKNQITIPAARKLLSLCTPGDAHQPAQAAPPTSTPRSNPALQPISRLIDMHDLRLQPLSDAEYAELAASVVAANEDMASRVREEVARVGPDRARGKLMWFVGQMVRAEGMQGRVVPSVAEGAVRRALVA